MEYNSESKEVQKMMTNIEKSLEGQYAPFDKGIWQIFGEDANCDFGGHHSNPLLETVEGTYNNVVKYALSLPSFITWGAGGLIKKIVPTANVDNLPLKRIRELEKQISSLQEELKSLQSK